MSEGDGLDARTVPMSVVINGQKIEGWVWCSFADPDLPKGQQFLGVVVTEAARRPSLGLFGLNPGGQMQLVDIPPEHVPPEQYRNRLLTRAEAVEAGTY